MTTWRGGRAVQGAALEMLFGATQRGFESHPLRSYNTWVSEILDSSVAIEVTAIGRSLFAKCQNRVGAVNICFPSKL